MNYAKRLLSPLSLLVILCFMTHAQVVEPPGVPNIVNPAETQFQQQTHFLVFTGTDTAGESAATANAYYDAIDPTKSKRTFTQWLVKAGFIQNEGQWHATGAQLVACNLPGCDLPAGTYGDNVINADSHAIVLNAADLGFVRNQFIRCQPSCSASNPIIYTYLENYPVNPFAASGNGGSGFPIKTGYPSQAEATAAIQSALTRPKGDLAGCTAAATDTVFKCSIQRIADVAFEWAPPPTNLSSSSRYGQLYAYILNNDLTETISLPAGSGVVGQTTPNVAAHVLNTINAGDPFPPNLDFLGFKQHPGVCLICHGGNPKNLTSTGAYPQQGRLDGFRFLPLDVRNLIFTSDGGPDQPRPSATSADFPTLSSTATFTDRANQEAQMKAYNQAVLKTVNQQPQRDEQGALRQPHLVELIKGWYAAFAGDQTMSGATQKDFTPVGWQGSAALGNLYSTAVGPSCRSCHFNRELTLDFGTVANFDAYRADILELTVLPFCKSNNPEPGKRPMPLAHLTYQRFWQANNTAQTLPSGQPPLTLFNTAEQIANHFGFSGVAGYCASRR